MITFKSFTPESLESSFKTLYSSFPIPSSSSSATSSTTNASISLSPPLLKSYNLAFTKTWMMLIPRSNAVVKNIHVNALGMIGMFMLTSQDDVNVILKKINAFVEECGYKEGVKK